MAPISDQQIDDLILSVAHVNWRKVATIIIRTMEEGEIDGIQVEDSKIAARIRALVRERKLEGQGNLSRWRHSEVRLPPGQPPPASAAERQNRPDQATGHEAGGTGDVARLSLAISGLVSRRRFEQARGVILSAERLIDQQERHRLLGWSAMVEEHAGNLTGAIALLRKAAAEQPDFLSYLSALAECLVQARMWEDAIATFDRLILRSEEQHERYFLDDARLRKMLCLQKLGRDQEIKDEQAKVDPGARTWFEGRHYSADDFA